MNQEIGVSNIRVGNIIELKDKNDLFEVRDTKHVKPGKGGAYIQVELKGLNSHTKLNIRFNSSETVQKAILEEKHAQFLYEDGEDCHFMFLDGNGEQFEIKKEDFKPLSNFLQDEIEIQAKMHNDKVISFEFANPVVMEITDADPVIKGQTAASSNKSAILENGMKISVPTYIKVGDKVIVDPENATYKERFKS